MTITSENDRNITTTSWLKSCVYVIAIIFNLCLIAQVLTVGVAYFTDPAWWHLHVWLVRGYGGLSIVLWVGTLLVPFSTQARSLTTSLPILLGLQFCLIHFQTPLHLEVLHPLVGFTLFYVSSSLVHRIAREEFAKTAAVIGDSIFTAGTGDA